MKIARVTCRRLAHEDPSGFDENSALDYVAKLACPSTHLHFDSREELAKHLLVTISAAHRQIRDDDILPLLKLAEALMGEIWVKLFLSGLSQR